MNPLLGYVGSVVLNIATLHFLTKWRRRALVAEAELAAREALHLDDTPANFAPRERATK